MRDRWFGDARDLVKWATLVTLVQKFGCKHILQILYYQPNEWAQIEIDGEKKDIPHEVVRHFRDVESVQTLDCGVPIKILKEKIGDRDKYQKVVLGAIAARNERPGLVLLDPDTGLEPASGRFNLTHVRSNELLEIWSSLNQGDLLVFYQHEDNKAGKEWRNRKKDQFSAILGQSNIPPVRVGQVYAPSIARVVAFFFAEKSEIDSKRRGLPLTTNH